MKLVSFDTRLTDIDFILFSIHLLIDEQDYNYELLVTTGVDISGF